VAAWLAMAMTSATGQQSEENAQTTPQNSGHELPTLRHSVRQQSSIFLLLVKDT